ncbi:Formate hydrogenlyase subunit 3, partial [mine drainage metagenome]
MVLLALAIVTAVLTGLYAFQQDDWPKLLAFSSAENAAIAAAALGAALIFRGYGQDQLAALAWIVGLVQLMGHSLAKGALFFTADAAHHLTGSDQIRPDALFRKAPWTLGVGALCAVMSLAALPPTIGFVSEWYLFQILFHDFVISGAGARIALTLAGAGLALTAAIALATMVKLFGVGLLGLPASEKGRDPSESMRRLPRILRPAILVTGLAVPVFAVSLIGWLPLMQSAASPILDGRSIALVHHWLLIPLSTGFAFISPALLVIVWP